jgi:hypothetical protein
MLRRITLSVFATAMMAMAASAADLPAQSRLGAVFADPAPVTVYAYQPSSYWAVYAPPVDIPPLVAGYYGKPNSYYYAPYYGGSSRGIYNRLPYACGWYGYC